MALINDPTDLSATEVTIDTSGKTITLNVAGNLSADGVTGQALYSYLKEQWKTDATKIPFLFPMEAITPESFEFINDWAPANDATRKLIRTCGWAERVSGVIAREYMGFISLGNIDATRKTVGDKAYYAFASDASKTDFTYAGPVDEAVQIYGDASNGNFDKRAEVLTAFIRIQGKTFGQVTTADIGVSTLTYIAYRFPLSEADDLKYSDQSPYTGMTITYSATPVSSSSFLTSDLSGGPYNFHVVIDPNGATASKTYAFIQDQLRTDGDIDNGAGTVNGLLADSLAEYVGDTFKTKTINSGTWGVALDGDNLDSNDINSVVFRDDTGAERTFPFVAAGTINFSQTLQDDASAQYWMFFTNDSAADTPAGNNFGTVNAIIVDNNAGVDIAGNVSGNPSIAFDFDYDGNVQRGVGSDGSDAPITIVAIGLSDAQYVVTTGIIERKVGQNYSLVAAKERNYANP